MIRALIIDDEPLSRRKIREYLKRDSDIQVIGECASGAHALEAVRRDEPDLLFLDVQMPGMDGFTLLDELDGERLPFVIFVTAYDQYAVKAFEVHALDYLLKPFHRERFARATERAKAHIRSNKDGLTAEIRELLRELRPAARYLERVMLKNAGSVFFLRCEEIDWIAAEENYVRLHAGKASHLLREKISAFETQLDPTRFQRIHRSAIVNLDRIGSLHPLSHGDYQIVLRDGTELVLSRAFRKNIK